MTTISRTRAAAPHPFGGKYAADVQKAAAAFTAELKNLNEGSAPAPVLGGSFQSSFTASYAFDAATAQSLTTKFNGASMDVWRAVNQQLTHAMDYPPTASANGKLLVIEFGLAK